MFDFDILPDSHEDRRPERQGPAPFRHVALIGNALPTTLAMGTSSSSPTRR